MQVAEKILEEETARCSGDNGYTFETGVWWGYYLGRIAAERGRAPKLKDVEKIVEEVLGPIDAVRRSVHLTIFTQKVKNRIQLSKIQSWLAMLPSQEIVDRMDLDRKEKEV
jgi:hypothetical protein